MYLGRIKKNEKIIKTKKEEFYYDTNNKIEGKTLNSFDKNDNLIRKEYFDISFSVFSSLYLFILFLIFIISLSVIYFFLSLLLVGTLFILL